MVPLKRLISIALLLSFLFNLVGYRIAFYAMQERADDAFSIAADENRYDDSKLIAVHIPINLPYQTDWKNFERVDGEMEYKGKVYKYVKRKVSKGELIILCLPDENKTRINNAREAFDKLAVDLQADHNGAKKHSIVKDVQVEGLMPGELFSFLKLHEPRPGYRPYAVIHITEFPHLSPEQPPEA